MFLVTQTITLVSGDPATSTLQTKIKQAVVVAAAGAMGIAQSAITVTSVTPTPTSSTAAAVAAASQTDLRQQQQQLQQQVGSERRGLSSIGAIAVYTAAQANGNATALRSRLARAVASGTFTKLLAQTVTGAYATLLPGDNCDIPLPTPCLTHIILFTSLDAHLTTILGILTRHKLSYANPYCMLIFSNNHILFVSHPPAVVVYLRLAFVRSSYHSSRRRFPPG